MAGLFRALRDFWKDMPLQGKVAWLLACGMVPVCLCLTALFFSLTNTVAKARWAIDAGMAQSGMLVTETDHLQWMHQVARLVNGGDAWTEKLTPMERCSTSYWLHGAECRQLRATSPRVSALLNALEVAHTRMHIEAQKLVALLRADKMAAAQRLYREEILPASEQIVRYFYQVRRAFETEMAAQQRAFATMAARGRLCLVGVILALSLWLVAVVFAVRYSLTTPLRHILRVTQSVRDGDKTARTGLRHRDEIGRIAQNLDQMIDTLHTQYTDLGSRSEANARLLKRLHALTHALQALLLSSEEEFDASVAEVLGVLGTTLNADRVYICANRQGEDGRLFCDQLYEWTADGNPLPADLTHNVSYDDTLPEWRETFAQGQSLNMRVHDCDPRVRAHKEAQNADAFLVTPMYLHNQLWGFLGLDARGKQRLWAADEEDFAWNTGVLLSASILHHQTEAHLGAALASAREATEARTAFFARMSHELRTPLNAISGLTFLALREDNTPKQTDYFRRIQNASATLLGIVNDVLDFSRIEAQKLELESAPFSPRECLGTVQELLSPRAREKGIDLSLCVAPDLPETLLGDALRMRQILTNLVNNAVKFTEWGGVLVELDVVDNNAAGATLRFSVSDTGIGMTRAQMDKLFQPFSQTDGSIARRYGGSGLGLVISKDLLAKMGGDLHVNSEPGQGTEFCFVITLPKPATAETPGGTGTAQTQEIPDFTGLNALVVDDNDVNRMIMGNLLELANMTVEMAADGQQAVDCVKKRTASCASRVTGRVDIAALPYDIILMDVQMPVMDGLEATGRIRKLACGARVPIIALTAHTAASDYARSLEAGMNDHIPKPVEPAYLYTVLARWMGRA